MRGRRGLYGAPVKPTRPKSAHDRVIAKCIADGLIDAEHKLTAAGHQYCHDTIGRLNAKECELAQRFNPDASQ